MTGKEQDFRVGAADVAQVSQTSPEREQVEALIDEVHSKNCADPSRCGRGGWRTCGACDQLQDAFDVAVSRMRNTEDLLRERERELTRALAWLADFARIDLSASHDEVEWHGRPGAEPRCPQCVVRNALTTPTAQRSAPSVADIVGLAPDMAGGLSPEEYVRRLRGDEGAGSG